MSVVFTLKDIMGLRIFVYGRSKERKNGALKVVDVAILSYGGIGDVQDKNNEAFCRSNCHDNTRGADSICRCINYREFKYFKHELSICTCY